MDIIFVAVETPLIVHDWDVFMPTLIVSSCWNKALIHVIVTMVTAGQDVQQLCLLLAAVLVASMVTARPCMMIMVFGRLVCVITDMKGETAIQLILPAIGQINATDRALATQLIARVLVTWALWV